MGQNYSTKPNNFQKRRNVNSGNFLIVVDESDDVLETSVLEEPSIVQINASFVKNESQLQKKIIQERSFDITNSLIEKQIDSFEVLTQQPTLFDRRKCHSHSHVELPEYSEQQKREDKTKKVCTCRFIITSSDIANHEGTLRKELKRPSSYTSRTLRNKDTYSFELPNTQAKQKGISENQNKAEFYQYENSKITMLSSVVRIPTEERIKQEFVSPMSPPTEAISINSSDSLKAFLESQDENQHFVCPFCGAPSSSRFSTGNTSELSSMRPSRTSPMKIIQDEELSTDPPKTSSNKEVRKSRKVEKEKLRPSKKSKASTANFVTYTKNEGTLTSSAVQFPDKEPTNCVSKSLLAKQCTPERLYISLKKNEMDSTLIKEHSKETIQNAVSEKPPVKLENSATTSFSTTDRAIDCNLIDEEEREEEEEQQNISLSQAGNSDELITQQSKDRLEEEKTMPLTEQQPPTAPESKLDKLSLQNVNMSSFKSKVSKSYLSANVSSENKNQVKPAKIILEIPGSLLPRNILEKIAKSQIKTYSSPESLESSKQVNNLPGKFSNQDNSKCQSAIPKKTTKDVDAAQQRYKDTLKECNILLVNELIQTNNSNLPDSMKKNLEKSDVFLYSIKPYSIKSKHYGKVFKEIHKYPKYTNLLPTVGTRTHNEDDSTSGEDSTLSLTSSISGSYDSDISDVAPIPRKKLSKRKNISKYSKEHLTKISESSHNNSLKSSTSTSSETQMFRKRSFSNQSIRRNGDSSKSKPTSSEPPMQKEQDVQDKDQEALKHKPEHSHATRSRNLYENYLKHRKKQPLMNTIEEKSPQDFRESSAHENKQFKKIDKLRRPKGSTRSILSLMFNQFYHTSIYFRMQLDQACKQKCSGNTCNSKLLRILKDLPKTGLKEGKALRSRSLRSSDFSLGYCYGVNQYIDTTKNCLVKYNKNAINELFEKI